MVDKNDETDGVVKIDLETGETEFIPLDDSGLEILAYLYFKTSASFSEIQKKTNQSSKTTSIQLKKLESKDLVKKEHKYVITEKGLEILEFFVKEDLRPDPDYDSKKWQRLKRAEEDLITIAKELGKGGLKLEDVGNLDVRWYSLVMLEKGKYIEITEKGEIKLNIASSDRIHSAIKMRIQNVLALLNAMQKILANEEKFNSKINLILEKIYRSSIEIDKLFKAIRLYKFVTEQEDLLKMREKALKELHDILEDLK
ncbi:MAG: hypothetical protein H0Z19_08500 [Archaeoglobus sp.]|uniref:winged helix-turn-helix domain-containing protein n=1 Tax=Archaeoglobus sp. TaxID=1872626 RepID=UPI001DBAFCD7|nr:winged helix-turn-helix domain-containing protein [Archaeoglobus sp.]MBO8180500.1 hypothetical protein [Archaeoglobus sp.]